MEDGQVAHHRSLVWQLSCDESFNFLHMLDSPWAVLNAEQYLPELCRVVAEKVLERLKPTAAISVRQIKLLRLREGVKFGTHRR